MIFYIVISFILILGAIKFELTKKRNGKNYIIFLITFILAFNYQMGTDWIVYQESYEKILTSFSLKDYMLSEKRDYEIGYIILSYIFAKLGFNYEVFNGIVLGICIYILLNEMYKKSDNYYLAFIVFITLYLFVTSLEPVIRQLISITIITYSFKYIENRSFFKYFFGILLAIQFHNSAIICIFLYFFDYIKIKKKDIVLLIFIIFIIITHIRFILEIFSNIFPILSDYLNYFYNTRYAPYTKNNLQIVRETITLISYLYIIFFSYNFSSKKRIYINNIGILYLVFRYFSNYLPILFRINTYFIFSFAVCMSNIGNLIFFNKKRIKLNKRKINYIYVVVLLIPLIFQMKNKLYGKELNKFRYLNYKNYFIEMINENLPKSFNEKRKEYEKNIEQLIKKENQEKKK